MDICLSDWVLAMKTPSSFGVTAATGWRAAGVE
jgi:hypothetical protein